MTEEDVRCLAMARAILSEIRQAREALDYDSGLIDAACESADSAIYRVLLAFAIRRKDLTVERFLNATSRRLIETL